MNITITHHFTSRNAGPLRSTWTVCAAGSVLFSTQNLRTFRARLNQLAGSRQRVPNDDQTGRQWTLNWFI